MPGQFQVFYVRFHLAEQDPEIPGQQYHTTIFVQTDPDGSGTLHHVTGDISSRNGMRYVPTRRGPPRCAQTFESMEHLGITDAVTHPELWSTLLSTIPSPPQQKAFNIVTRRFEQFKTLEPLTFYEPEEPRQPLIKCMEWTLNRAIPALKCSGLIR